jgi:hypothetical protein
MLKVGRQKEHSLPQTYANIFTIYLKLPHAKDASNMVNLPSGKAVRRWRQASIEFYKERWQQPVLRHRGVGVGGWVWGG